MAQLDPIEADIWRRAMAGQQPDPSMLYAEPAAPDPSAGLPPEAVAGPGFDPFAAEGRARMAQSQAGGPSATGITGTVSPLTTPEQTAASTGVAAPPPPVPAISGPVIGAAPGAATTSPELRSGLVPPAIQQATQAAVKGIPRRVGGAAQPQGGVPAWLKEYAGQEGLAPEPPERDPHLPGIPETPGEQRVRQELQGEAFAGAEDQFEAEKYAREAQLRSQRAAMEAQQKVDLENQQRAAERRQRMEQREQRFREMADAAAAEPIDSNRLWNNMSTGEKVMQRIAIFLGALGTAQGGPNVAMQKIEADINRDMEAQKFNKQSKFRRVDDEKTLYDMAGERFEDEATQDAAVRESAYRKIGQQLEFFGQHVQEPARREGFEGLKREIDARILAAEQDRRRANEIHVMQLEAARAKALAAGGRRPDEKYFVPDRGFARDAKALEGARGLAVAQQELIGALDEMDRLRREGATEGALGVGSKAYHQATTTRGKVVAAYAKILAGGYNPSQQIEEKAEELVGDPTSWRGDKYKAQTDALREAAKNSAESGMQQYIKQKTPFGWRPESER